MSMLCQQAQLGFSRRLCSSPGFHRSWKVAQCFPLSTARARQGRSRHQCCTTAVLSAKPGPIATIVTEQLKEVAAGLDPRSQFLISHGVSSLLVPLLCGWLATSFIHLMAKRARVWCDENPDEPAVAELLGLLPAALEYPSVVTINIMVAVRLLRNAAWMLDTYVHTFSPKLNRAVDALVEGFCSYLIPIDHLLVKLYSIATVVFLTVAFVKAKTIALEFFLLKAQHQPAQDAAAAGTSSRKAAVGTVEDFERLLVPLDALASWLASMTGGLICAQLMGVNIAPLLAVGGASGIIVGLATQQLLTNAVMGLSLFFTRPFVAGDSVTCQGGGATLTGVVERVTPMRTYIRTEDDIIVTVPNKTVADMVVYNRSTSIKRSRLAAANRKYEPLKVRIKVPHTAAAKLGDVQSAAISVLTAAVVPVKIAAVAASGGLSSSGSETDFDISGGSRLAAADLRRSSSTPSFLSEEPVADLPLVQPGSVEVQLTKFTDAGIELLLKANLKEDPSSQAVQTMLLNLSSQVRAAGAVMVNL